jgi:hypothetical protein
MLCEFMMKKVCWSCFCNQKFKENATGCTTERSKSLNHHRWKFILLSIYCFMHKTLGYSLCKLLNDIEKFNRGCYGYQLINSNIDYLRCDWIWEKFHSRCWMKPNTDTKFNIQQAEGWYLFCQPLMDRRCTALNFMFYARSSETINFMSSE